MDACRAWSAGPEGAGGHISPPPGPVVPMSAQRLLLPLLMVGLTSGASLPQGPGSHLGVCPNQLSPNLWVDAQSTCERECVEDQVSTWAPSSPTLVRWGVGRKLGWPGERPDLTHDPRPCLYRGPQLQESTSSLAPTLLPGVQSMAYMRLSGYPPIFVFIPRTCPSPPCWGQLFSGPAR